MYLKKVLNQPNVVGIVMIALLFCAGFVYAFAFDGFNIEIVPSAEVETLSRIGPNYGKDCANDSCVKTWAGCPGNGCADCTDQSNNCHSNCGHTHPKCGASSDPKCPFNTIGKKYCSRGGNSCPKNCNKG